MSAPGGSAPGGSAPGGSAPGGSAPGGSAPGGNTAEWFACPSCHTLGRNSPTADSAPSQLACPHCALPLAWLEQSLEFRQALSLGNRAWAPRLRLTLQWPGGKTELQAEGPGPFDLVAEGTTPLRVRLDTTCGPLVVEGHGVSIDLPGNARQGETLFSARMTAELIATGAPRPVGRLGHFKSLKETRGDVRIGRDARNPLQDMVLADEGISFIHAVAVYAAAGGSYWIADAGSAGGTFVNGEPIVACRLATGDLVQIGRYAWVFSDAEGLLEPVDGIDGMRLDFAGAGVSGRLGPLNLGIAAGQYVGVAGRSGAGKSTLLKALIGMPGIMDQGQMFAEGRRPADAPEWFRGRLGYVSQDKAIHEGLTAREAVAFSAALRGRRDFDAAPLLRQVGLRPARWDAQVGELSGGEEKRVRIAAELVSGPGLLVLDEPGSGLDWAREEALSRLLKTLSRRGCTVIVATHNQDRLADFDRILGLYEGTIVFDGPPRVLRDHAPSGDLAKVDFGPDFAPTPDDTPTPDCTPMSVEPKVSGPPVNTSSVNTSARREANVHPLRQTMILARRELALMRNRRLKWAPAETWRRLRSGPIDPNMPPRSRAPKRVEIPYLFVPILAVPICFATALHLAIKPADRSMLGFLSVLSCIWMGASLSSMSIVNEREVFDHERLLFLRTGPFVAAKTIMLGFSSVVQTMVFFTWLFVLRRTATGDGMLLAGAWPAGVLVLVGLAATGLGLVISAAARRNKSLPNFILPLVMIVQVLFSVQVAGDGKSSLYRAYGEFNGHHCRMRQRHAGPRRAERWLPPASRPMADPLGGHPADPGRADPLGESDPLPTGWYCSDCADPKRRAPLPESDRRQDNLRPNLAASLGSYLTLSRYGDIALRSFAYSRDDEQAFLGESNPAAGDRSPAPVRYGYRRWRIEALAVLVIAIALAPLATWAMLSLQSAARAPIRHGRT